MSTLIVLLLSFFAANICAQDIAKSDCQENCGNVSIVYPFGIHKECYLDERYEIECKMSSTSNLYEPFLVKTGMLVYNITLANIYVANWNVSTCYTETKTNGSKIYNLTGEPFALSTNNKFTAIGCDTYAYITDLSSINPTSGCISLCDGGNSYIDNGSCSGNGCCQTEIPYQYYHLMKNFEVGTISINTKNTCRSSTGGECSMALIGEDLRVDKGNYVQAIAQSFSRSMELTWRIDGTCDNAICGKNSYCSFSSYYDDQNYNCECSGGNDDIKLGNPYLPNGCKKALGGGLLLMILLGIVYWFYGKMKKRRIALRKSKFFKRNGGLLLEQQISSGESNIKKSKIFLQEELEKATDNFNENRILGRGGSGTVYKGMLPDGRIVAIKKSKIVDESQISQFINELVILSQINHRHIVKVMGCCLETEVPLLVYEFVSNGTLFDHLHKEDRIASISWVDRLRITKEIAGALLYLHSAASTPIYHRDIKSSNILLEETYRAKVSDFGISRSITDEQTHLTTLVQGTFGYLDPEYFHSGQFTDKSDVYSFGVVLVELLTGQKPVSLTRSEDEANLAMCFISSVKEDRVIQLLEARIAKEAWTEDIKIVASLAKKCLKLVGKKRPTMREVCMQLENLKGLQPQDSVSLL